MGAARGAAVLAGMGVGAFPAGGAGVDWAAQPVETPDPAGSAALERGFRTYAGLYPALAGSFAAAATEAAQGTPT
jgi:hypothetical protein